MEELDICDFNLFMICDKINRNAFSKLPAGFHWRLCRKDELEIWKAFPFDNLNETALYSSYMTEYFEKVYLPEGDLFFKNCLFVCDEEDAPVATCFLWKAYGTTTTLHWFKVKKDYEGMGIGRALLSILLKDLPDTDLPIYLHTQPSSYRAIKLYTDFGFSLLTDEKIGKRVNQIDDALPYLESKMKEHFSNLKFKESDGNFSRIAEEYEFPEF